MPQGQEWRDEGLDQEGDSWGDAPEGQRGLLRPVPPPTSRSAARAEGFGSVRIADHFHEEVHGARIER